MHSLPPAIAVNGLVKSFGKVRALDGVDLEAAPGTVLGVLGPNGAGKTTTVRILSTLLSPDAGSAHVTGLDVVREAAQLRSRIGLAGQNAAVDENLTGLENLVMVGRLYGNRRRAAKARAAELLERFGLTEAGGRVAKTYSGGMRRRLDLGASLVGQPRLLLLDEPSTGMNREEKEHLARFLLRIKHELGLAMLWVEHDMELVADLADVMTVLDFGQKLAEGAPDSVLRDPRVALAYLGRPVI